MLASHFTKRSGLILNRAFGAKTSTFEDSRKADYWNTVGEWYTKHSYKASNKVYSTMAPFLRLETAHSILDAGGGAGNGVEVMLQHVPEDARFTLIDISDYFLEKATQKNLPKTKILKANAELLPFENQSFDRYVSNGLLEMVENPEWMVNEAYRVLKHGGVTALSIYGRMGPCTALRLYKTLRMRLRLRKQAAEPKFELSDPEKVKEIFKRAGFSKVLYFYEQYHYPNLDYKELFDLYYNAPTLREPAEKEGKLEDLKKLIEEELNKILVDREELLTYESMILVAHKK